MPDVRTPEQILRDWREAEAFLPDDGSAPSPDLLARIGYLRAEHLIAMERRAAEAAELARPPGWPHRKDELAPRVEGAQPRKWRVGGGRTPG
jgi:hypothetical protein